MVATLNRKMKNRKSGSPAEAGQTLLIIVLIMVVVLTIGLSVASRSITNLRTSTEEENSQRAFSAAEAGVERALQSRGNIGSVDLLNNASIKQATYADLGGTQFVPNNGGTIAKDDGIDIWLSSYPDYASPWSGSLTIHWGTQGSSACSAAAVEIIILSGSSAAPISNRYVYDACTSRQSGNNFTLSTSTESTISGVAFAYKTPPIAVSSGLLARVIPLYANTPIGVEGSVALPTQGKQIQSTGISGSTIRQVTYYQGYPELPPEFFQYILFQPSIAL